MLILGLFLVSKLAGSAATAVRAVSGPQLGGGNVSWQSTCEPFVTDYDNNTHPATECGLFQVPRNYANSSAGTFTIAVARRNATVGPRLGTIFVNPGLSLQVSLSTSPRARLKKLCRWPWAVGRSERLG